MAYDNTNTGALFQNKNRTNDKQPHAKGTINIEGVEYWISAWTRVSQHGKRYQQLAVTKKEEKKTVPNADRGAPGTDHGYDNSFDEDIPF